MLNYCLPDNNARTTDPAFDCLSRMITVYPTNIIIAIRAPVVGGSEAFPPASAAMK